MRNKLKIYGLAAVILCGGIATMSSCSRGYGCPSQNANVKPDRKGKYNAKRSDSNLFPKDMRKRLKVS
jgi:hypothetical protein